MQTKPTLIILPGWGGNELLWQHQCQHLKDIVDPRVIVISDQDTSEKMADAVIAKTTGKFILCGHSLGGWIAQRVAIKAPERVTKLILMGTWSGYSSSTLLALLKQILVRIEAGDTQKVLDELRPSIVDPARSHDEELMQIIKTSQSKFPVAGLINQKKVEISGGDMAPFLSLIQCPTLIIQGRQDAFFSLEVAQGLYEKIPNAKFTIVENCGHMLSVEQPQAITALIRLWVTMN